MSNKKCEYCDPSYFIRKVIHGYIIYECNNCGYIQLPLSRVNEFFYRILMTHLSYFDLSKINELSYRQQLIIKKYQELTNFQKIINNKTNLKTLINLNKDCDLCRSLLSYFKYLNKFEFYYCSYNNLIIFSEDSLDNLLKYLIKRCVRKFYWLRFKHQLKKLIWKENE